MTIHLTFDDGPGPSTAALIEVLREHDTRATFFIIGKNVEEPQWCGGDRSKAAGVVLDAIRDGHEIGNHTFSHRLQQNELEFVHDIEQCDRVISDLHNRAGRDAAHPIRVRLPYGVQFRDSKTLHRGLFRTKSVVLDPRMNLLASIGRSHFHWTDDFDDWRTEVTADQLFTDIVHHITEMENHGLHSVVVLHDASEQSASMERPVTVEAVRRLLTEAKAKNWKFEVP